VFGGVAFCLFHPGYVDPPVV